MDFPLYFAATNVGCRLLGNGETTDTEQQWQPETAQEKSVCVCGGGLFSAVEAKNPTKIYQDLTLLPPPSECNGSPSYVENREADIKGFPPTGFTCLLKSKLLIDC